MDEDGKEVKDKVRDDTLLPVSVSAVAAARRKFNVYFTTFWHLVHLAASNCWGSDIAVTWEVTSLAGLKWGTGLSWEHRSKLDQKVYILLKFVQNELDELNEQDLSGKSRTVVAKYDQCLGCINRLVNQMGNDTVDALRVCRELVDSCVGGTKSFKKLPLFWNHLFVSRIRQLLLLAQDCYQGKSPALTQLFERHTNFTTEIRNHFFPQLTKFTSLNESTYSTDIVDSADDAKLVDLKLIQPTISLDELIVKLSENATCAAEQIPTAVTAIIHKYSHFDPFNPDDMQSIQTNVAALHNILNKVGQT